MQTKLHDNSKQPLNDVEIHEILRLIYPEIIKSDEDLYFDISQDICENATVNLGDVEVSLAELLGRVVMLTMPLKSPLSGDSYHCLGEVVLKKDGDARMIAVVKRKATA